MTASFVPSDFLARLRRSLTVSGVLFLSLTGAICGDDDDDGGTGPSADCIDEINWSGAPAGFDEDDAVAIGENDSDSGTLSASDPEDEEGAFFDAYVLAVGSDGEFTITANPSGFDLVLALLDDNLVVVAGSDDQQDADATEEIVEDLEEGCYVIVITSFGEGETGSYSLEVDGN